jgi:hypothetical protein
VPGDAYSFNLYPADSVGQLEIGDFISIDFNAVLAQVVARGKELGRKVYVATNLLESMVVSPKPTRAEVNDVINTLLDGADGLILAAETAIGKDPVGCVSMIVKLIDEYRAFAEQTPEKPITLREYLPQSPGSLLIAPHAHGGHLVDLRATAEAAAEADSLPKLAVAETVLLDAQQLAVGAYSPLRGFMDRETLDSVLAEHRLPNGLAWPMPMLLPLTAAAAKRFAAGDRVSLTDAEGTAYAILTISEVFRYDLEHLSRGWFATASPDHPGVARLLAGGNRSYREKDESAADGG